MSSCLDAARPETAPAETQRFRPAVHFTARDTWLNDPNGLVFHQGLYHLFFQNNPFGNVWGNMSWGHATSPDLLHWTQHPVAIACNEEEDIFSGSIVVDHGNTTRFGIGDEPALVAIYTSAYKAPSEHCGTQAQSLAYSTDAGMTWQKYAPNPVLTRNSANFRDPKVFRYQGDQGTYWVMAAVEAQDQKVMFYRSKDLKSWEFLSEFGPANSDTGEWECPDLFPLAVDGDQDNLKWVLIVNVNPGGVAGGSGGQYFVGHFDGIRFVADPGSLAQPDGVAAITDAAAASTALEQCLWLDWGRDCYASVSFSNMPDDRRIIIGWMNNWDYANQLPTNPWRSSMTLAREVRLATVDGAARLVQQPVLVAIDTADGPEAGTVLMSAAALELNGAGIELPDAVTGAAQVIEAEIIPGTAGSIELRIFAGGGGNGGAVVGYDSATSRLTLDRTQTGGTAFHDKFASVESAPLVLDDGLLKLLVVVDHCSVEVFAQDGAVVLTDLVFPGAGSTRNWLSAAGGTATVQKLTVSTLK